MGDKLRHVLIFLLIILKEPVLPEAACKCSISTRCSIRPRWVTPRTPCCNCGGLGLSNIPQNIPKNIAFLYFGNNQITNFPPQNVPNSIAHLDLRSNLITSIQPDALSNLLNLEILNLDKNGITDIKPGVFLNNHELWGMGLCSNNKMDIQPGALSKLRVLYLFSNQITSIEPGSFTNLPNLQSLYLKANQISSIRPDIFCNLPNLNSLNLAENQITSIQLDTFTNLPNFEWLHLQMNQITSIQPGIFSNLPKLRYLNLQSNQISVLPLSAHGMLSAIRVVKIDKNPWQCDCGMVPFRMKMTGSASFENQITCAQPANFRWQKLIEINPEDLICKETSTLTLHFDLHTSFTSSAVSTSSFGNTESKTSPTAYFLDSTTDTQSVDIQGTFTSSAVSTYSFDNTESNTSPTAYFLDSTTDTQSIDNQGTFTSSAVSTSSIDNTESNTSPTTYPAGFTSDKKSLVKQFERANNCCNSTATSPCHWYFRTNPGSAARPAALTTPLAIRSDSFHESAPSFPLPVLIGSICGPIAGILLAGSIILTIWCQRRARHPPSGQNSKVIVTDAKAKATRLTSGHDQTGQGLSQANALDVGNLRRSEVLASLRTNPMYAGVGISPEDSILSTSGHNQTGQGQPQGITEYNTNTTAAVIVSGHGQTGSQAITGLLDTISPSDNSHDTGVPTNLNSLYKVVGQYQAIIIPDTNITAAVMTSDHDHQYEGVNTQHDQTGYGQSQAITTISTEATIGHDQTGQGKSQATTHSLDGRNPAYGNSLYSSQPNPIYTGVGSPPNNPKSTGTVVPPIPPQKKAPEPPNRFKPPKDEIPSFPQPRKGAEAPPAVTEPHRYENMDSPLNSPKPKETPSLLPPRRGTDALQVVTEPHLYEDVDGPQENTKPRDTVLGQFIKNKALGTADKNNPPKDEPPPIPPPRKGADALQVVSETHWYEDVDAPLNSPKPKETPSLLPPRRGADALQVVSEPHLYEDVDSPLNSPKPRDTGLRHIKNKALGTANKNNLPKDEPPPQHWDPLEIQNL